jgi:conjugative relaxase-like TrwC/TraI family protein
MMVLSPQALEVGQAETYFEEHYSHDDYYSEGHKVAGRWFGRGAEALGLSGEVSREDFSALLKGLHPKDGAVLVPAAAHNQKHRAGWDGVFSAPKSVSVQALAGGDHRLVDAHRGAVEKALVEVEKYALSRQRAGHESVVTANVIAARFDHIAARPSENAPGGQAPDPQLHTHVVFLNLTRRPDRQWRALDPQEIYRSQIYTTAVYRAELARAAEQLGYRIAVTASNGAWELEGYSREQVMAFSLRRQDIQGRMAEAGFEGAAAAQLIAYKTRQSKQQLSEKELVAEWRQRAVAYGINAHRIAMTAAERGSSAEEGVETIDEALRFSRLHNTEREAVIDRRALETSALHHAMGRAAPERVREWIAMEQERGQLIPIASDWRNPQGCFTTPEMLRLEHENIALMLAGVGAAAPIAAVEEATEWAIQRGLFADQIQAARVTLGAGDWVTAIDGRAGAAKTTTVGAIRDFAEQRGYTVRGFGPTSGSVKALSEAGVLARTVASLIENGKVETDPKQLWIIDESSLLATRQVNRLLRMAQGASVERVVFVGDQRQHLAIEAGNPISQMIRAEMTVARLNVIRRQRDPALKRTVEQAARGEVREALRLLEERQRIFETESPEKRYRLIAADYLGFHRAGQSTLVVSPANSERRELNHEIRETLIEHGQVGRDGREHAILVNRDLTRTQRRHASNYQEGDVIRFTRASSRMGIAKNAYLTVEAVDRRTNSLMLRAPDGRQIAFSLGCFKSIEAYRPEQRVIAVGERIQFRAPERSLKVVNGEFATIVEIAANNTVLKLDRGRTLRARLSELRHIDYGYASTSHAAQGATVDRVIVNIDTTRGVQLVNRRQFYVSLSRARYDARIYTNDAEALRRAAARNLEKAIALDALGRRPHRQSQSQSQRIAHQQYLNSLKRFADPSAPALAPKLGRRQSIRQTQKVARGWKW